MDNEIMTGGETAENSGGGFLAGLENPDLPARAPEAASGAPGADGADAGTPAGDDARGGADGSGGLPPEPNDMDPAGGAGGGGGAPALPAPWDGRSGAGEPREGPGYGGVRSGYDASKPIADLFRDFAGRAGMSVEDYLSRIRVRAKQAEGMSEQEARRAVERETREEARRQSRDQRRQADIREFAAVFPDAARDPLSIPQEVWARVRSGMSLVAAYAGYAAARARAEAEADARRAAAAQRNAENAARAAGSMRSAGAASRDPFLEGWNE